MIDLYYGGFVESTFRNRIQFMSLVKTFTICLSDNW